MKTNEIRFLPIEINEEMLSIKEPYLNELLIYLDKFKIEFEYIEARVNISASKIDDNRFDEIIKIVKDSRELILQKAIKKNYL